MPLIKPIYIKSHPSNDGIVYELGIPGSVSICGFAGDNFTPSLEHKKVEKIGAKTYFTDAEIKSVEIDPIKIDESKERIYIVSESAKNIAHIVHLCYVEDGVFVDVKDMKWDRNLYIKVAKVAEGEIISITNKYKPQ